jgi:hypothetical protein
MDFCVSVPLHMGIGFVLVQAHRRLLPRPPALVPCQGLLLCPFLPVQIGHNTSPLSMQAHFKLCCGTGAGAAGFDESVGPPFQYTAQDFTGLSLKG